MKYSLLFANSLSACELLTVTKCKMIYCLRNKTSVVC